MIYKIVFSPTGGTRKAVDLLMDVWKDKKMEVTEIDLMDPKKDFSDISFAKEDICYVAVPSFYGRVVDIARERIALLHGNGAKAVLVAVFGNRAFDDTLVELQDVLEEAGFVCMAAVAASAEHSLVRRFGAGRPDGADEKELYEYGEKIYERVTKEGSEKIKMTKLPGNRPYRAYGSMPVVPIANAECTECGVCAQKCPVGAIDPLNIKQTDEKKCIHCMMCTVICPEHARSMPKVFLEAMDERLEERCRERKENTLYL